MRPANDPHTNYRALVQRGYDQCAAQYEQARRAAAVPGLSLVINRLPAGAAILDVGCGSGVPVTRILAQQFRVTGVDISGEQIQRAQANVPQGIFIHADIMDISLPPSTFDAVISYYAIFHLPREEHPHLFQRVHEWLKPEGYFLATVAITAEDAYTEDDFFGVTMYWSNYGVTEYQAFLSDLGFQLLETTTIGHGYNQEEAHNEEAHPLIFAQKLH